MPNCLWTTIPLYILLTCTFAPHDSHAQLMITSDTPGPISQLLQLVWEPSSLIRMWTALDQLYNVLLGWRSAARTVVELPFRHGRSMDHIKIQVPRRFSRRQQGQSSDMPHWDWFKKVYDESPNAPAESLSRPVNAEESYQPGFQMVAQQSMNDPVVDGNVPLDLRQSPTVLTGNIHNSLNIPGANGNVLLNLQQSLSALSADRNVPFILQQPPNALRGNIHNSLNVPGASGNVLPNLQQSLSSLYGNVHNSLKVPGANRNVFLTLQQSLNTLKDTFRNSLNAPGANRNALATLHQSLNALTRGNFPNHLNSPGINGNDLFSLHQLPNVAGVGNNIQADIRNQNLFKPPFPYHHQEMFPNYNKVEFPNKNVDFRRNVKVAQPNNFVRGGGHTPSEQHKMKGPNNGNVPLMFFNANSVPNSNPETRLRMLLKLMGQLGEMHKKSVKAVEFDDHVNDRSSYSSGNEKL